MAVIGLLLLKHRDEIVHRWYEAWCASPHPHSAVSEKLLKNKLPVQLQVIGEQMRDMAVAEAPGGMWKDPARLDPEHRVGEGIPVQDIVLGYKLVVDVVRKWIDERRIDVTFAEFTYFYDAIFELVAEAVRRYVTHQAAEKSRERSEYLAGITHQMRSPLSAIALSLQLLEDDSIPENPRLSRIKRNVQRLRLLIDGVMRLERFKPGELPVKPCLTRPAQLIDELVDDQEPVAVRKGLKFDTHLNRSVEAHIDPELFRDACGNLIDNAVKYTPSGFVRVEMLEEPETLLFKVTDSGPGISEGRQQQLFRWIDPEMPGGAGIGLAVVHRVITAQGGEVGVESEPGKGTCFWFRLPRNVREQAYAHAATAE